MIVRNAVIKEIDKVMKFYGEVTDALKGSRKGPGWVKGVYPSYELVKTSAENGELYVAVLDEAIAGALILNHDSNEGFADVPWNVNAGPDQAAILHAFAVSPEYRGKGIGKDMLRQMVKSSREKGEKAIRLDVLVENIPADRLYEAAGFCRIAKKKLYYHPIGERDFWMYEYAL